MKPRISLRRRPAWSVAAGPPAVALPATMAAPFARLRTRGQRFLIAGAIAGLGGAALVAGGLYGLSGGGHVLPTTLTVVDLPAGLHAVSDGGGPLSEAIAAGMHALASVAGTVFRFAMGVSAFGSLLHGLHAYLGRTKRGEGEPTALGSTLMGAALLLGAWGAPYVVDTVTSTAGFGARERIVSAIQSGAFEPAMVEGGSEVQTQVPYLLAQRDQWQLQRPRSVDTKDRDAAYRASLRTALAQMPADAGGDPAIRYVLERTAFGGPQSAPVKAYVLETGRAHARAQQRGRIALVLGALLGSTAFAVAGLGGVIVARVRRVQAWLPSASGTGSGAR